MSDPQPGVRVQDEGVVRVLTIDNPFRRNALDPALLEQLREAVQPAATQHVRAFLIRGEGEKAFCSGYDLQSLDAVGDHGPLPDDLIGEVFAAIEAHPAPAIACLTGAAFGAGLELATACDFRIGAVGVRMCMPPARLGVIYAPEGLQRMVRLVGSAQAKMLFLTGRQIEAEEALRIGLLDELHPSVEQALAAARALAGEIARNGPMAISGMKAMFAALSGPGLSEPERAWFRGLRRAAFNSEDAKEGRKAFLEKRAPFFQGR